MTNKGMLTQAFNRQEQKTFIVKKNKNANKDFTCNAKNLTSKSWVTVSKPYKANDYDLEREYCKLNRLQRKYGICDFKAIDDIIKAEKIAKEEARLKREQNKRNKIAKIKTAQAIAVKVFNKNVFSEAFASHNHNNIIRMAVNR